MNELIKKQLQVKQRQIRTRSKFKAGGQTRPRLSVHISNRHVRALLVDNTGLTIASVDTSSQKMPAGDLTEKAVWVGAKIAELAKKKKITQVVFDRGAKLYHGRVKALAESARKAGLEF